MRRCDVVVRNDAKCLATGAALILALAGCSNGTDGDKDGMMMAQSPAMGAVAGGNANGQPPGAMMTTGTPGPTTGPSTPNMTAAGGNGGSGMNAGSSGGDVPSAMGGGGASGSGDQPGMPTAGTGDTTPPPATGVCDTSTFTQNCLQGGKQWGTPQQLGPCASGETVYGVKNQFGPYGVRSVHNVGKGFETGGTDDSAYCNGVFLPSFGADPVGTADLEDTHDLDYNLFTVFYPGCMPDGEKFPVISWGNGTCAMPEGYGPLLRYIASYGYIIVAANNREVGDGRPLTLGLDFMFAENDKMGSEFYQHVDKDKVGVMGHSQGSGAAQTAATDPRVKAVILWNLSTTATKPFLAVSGDRDLGGTAAGYKNAVNAAQFPAAWIWYHQIPAAVNGSTTGQLAPGHLTLMMESERVQEPALAWWDVMLKGKADAKKMFIGTDCTLCDPNAYKSMWSKETGPSLEYGHNDMLK